MSNNDKNTIPKILDALGKSRLLSSISLSDEALIFGLGFAMFVEFIAYVAKKEEERESAQKRVTRG